MKTKECNNCKKELLKAYTDFLLKEGYCDTDVYSEPPSKDLTIIDLFMIHKREQK